MSTLWCLTEAELGQHWVSSFLRTALKQERIREGNFAQKLLREEESGEVWSLHVQLSQLWIFSMDRITGHEIFWVERDPQGSSRHLGCCDFTQGVSDGSWWAAGEGLTSHQPKEDIVTPRSGRISKMLNMNSIFKKKQIHFPLVIRAGCRIWRKSIVDRNGAPCGGQVSSHWCEGTEGNVQRPEAGEQVKHWWGEAGTTHWPVKAEQCHCRQRVNIIQWTHRDLWQAERLARAAGHHGGLTTLQKHESIPNLTKKNGMKFPRSH